MSSEDRNKIVVINGRRAGRLYGALHSALERVKKLEEERSGLLAQIREQVVEERAKVDRDAKAPAARPNAVHMLFAEGQLPKKKPALDSIRAYIQKLEAENVDPSRNPQQQPRKHPAR